MNLHLLKRIFDRIFYNPYRAVKSNKFAQIGNSRLDRKFRIEFRTARERLSFQAGDDCILCCENIFESEGGSIKIGNGVFINGGTKLISRSSIEIEDAVTIAWNCTIYDHDSHSINYRERVKDQERQLISWDTGNFISNKNWSVVESKPIRICKYAWLGFDVVVLKGVTIGEGAIIGARSVVASDIPPWSIAVGSPARVVKQIPLHLRAPSREKASADGHL